MQMIVTVKILGTARGDKIVLHGQTCMHAYMRVFTVFHPIPRSGSLKASIYFRVLREEMQARGMSFEQCAIFLRTVNQMEAGVISQEQAERVVKGMIGEHSYIFHSWVRGCTSVRMYMGTRVCAYIWYVGVRAYVRACMCTTCNSLTYIQVRLLCKANDDGSRVSGRKSPARSSSEMVLGRQ